MNERRGFTLIEIMLAIVLTSVVALLAYGAIATAADVRERLEADREQRLAVAAWRQLVTETIRNLRFPAEFGDATLVVADGSGPDGVPADRLELITEAGAPPLAPGTDWRVSFAVEGEVLSALAVPLGSAAGPRVLAGPPGTTGLEVEVLSEGTWSRGWRSEESLPEAIRVTFWAEGQPVDVPIVLAVPRG